MEVMAASESRFAAYVEGLAEVIGHADRAVPLRDYCLGLLMPSERKSVEPMAAVTAPARVPAQHQSLLHFVGNAAWSDEAVLTKVRALVLPAVARSGPIEAWIIDDTGFPKKGRHSVGVTRQYCGQLGSRRCKATPAASRSKATARGKQDNCQVAVILSIANHAASLPVAYRLYLPQEWAADPLRRDKAGVPEPIGFATKPEIALDQIRAACAAGIPRGTVLMDAGYGSDTKLRTELTALGLAYVAGIQPHTTVWLRGQGPLPAKAWSRGFHHHATLCIAAYGFLISERETIPPSGPCATQKRPPLAVPDGYRSRGAADPVRTTHLKLDSHQTRTSHRRPRQEPRSMSMLQRAPQNR